jgi:PII-like signaling protein
MPLYPARIFHFLKNFPTIKAFISFQMRHGFGFNTNLLETNVLNLSVVVRIVVKVVGDALRELLDQRRKAIVSTLTEADKKKRGSPTTTGRCERSGKNSSHHCRRHP